MNVAMFDACNSVQQMIDITCSYSPYMTDLPAPVGPTSQEAATAAAAYRVLTQLHGTGNGSSALNVTLQVGYDLKLAADLAGIPDDIGQRANGVAYGALVADRLIAMRENDGLDDNTPYTLGGTCGDWRQTPDGPDVAAFSPNWGRSLPWGVKSGSQFRPTRLMDIGGGVMGGLMHSPEYAEQINGSASVLGVKHYGERNSVARTADQTEIAWFWANDRDGTSKPPGQLYQLTKSVVENIPSRTLIDNARVYALISIAMGDSCVVAWDSKYLTPIDLWRPIDAVRDTQDDGNPATTPDPAWLPLNDFSPPFPAYVSGHGTFGASHGKVMSLIFGDNTTFTLGSDEFGVHPGLGYPADHTRTFHSFSEAAWENALSRIYLGVHYYWDAVDANILGSQVGQYDFNHYLRPYGTPIPCPADFNEDGGIDGNDIESFFAAWERGTRSADVNENGGVDGTDVEDFFIAWANGGC